MGEYQRVEGTSGGSSINWKKVEYIRSQTYGYMTKGPLFNQTTSPPGGLPPKWVKVLSAKK